MKVWVECKSPLLQKSLELFLSKYLSSAKKCDIIIRDEPCLNDSRCFYIGTDTNADLLKPFSKSQLILALDKRYRASHKVDNEKEEEIKEDTNNMDFTILQNRIESLTQEYQSNILRAVKAFYEK